MLGSGWVRVVALGVLWGTASARLEAVAQRQGGCVEAVLDGDVKAGQDWARAIGSSLVVKLEATPAGWILRVLPASGARPDHDYAELATPPYRSVSPLLLTTDYGFRAQDAVGWNPRRFRFAANATDYQRLQRAFEAFRQTGSPSTEAQTELAKVVSEMQEGELQIVDARLVPGTADQNPAAAAVASHFLTTAHTLDQPADGRATQLGRLDWVRFHIRVELPRSFPVARGVVRQLGPCRSF